MTTNDHDATQFIQFSVSDNYDFWYALVQLEFLPHRNFWLVWF